MTATRHAAGVDLDAPEAAAAARDYRRKYWPQATFPVDPPRIAHLFGVSLQAVTMRLACLHLHR